LGKLKIFSSKELCRLLNNHGFTEIRQRGSHIIMQKKISGSTITVPIPNHNEIKIGTLLSIIRQSAIPRNEFEV